MRVSPQRQARHRGRMRVIPGKDHVAWSPGLMRRRSTALNVEGVSEFLDSGAREPVKAPRAVLLALDVLVAAVLGVLLTLLALAAISRALMPGPSWLVLPPSLIAAGCVATRRLAPLTSLTVAVAAVACSYALGFDSSSFVLIAIVLYIVATRYPPARSARAMALAGATMALVIMFVPKPLPVGYVRPGFWTLAVETLIAVAIEALGWALGVAVHRQRGYIEAVRVRASQEVRTEREFAARAAAEERLRIARELHDIVAHSMSVITVQAGVARYLLPEQEAETGRVFETIESTGRQAMRDMRQLLGVLRREGEDTPHSPAPGLADLNDLIVSTDAAGTRVELSTAGRPRPLPEGIELSAYRIVQEALTNVVKHAATDHARVRLVYEPEHLAIEVLDDGSGGDSPVPGGHGLTGMRERAALHGGTLEAGPLPVRGYRVAARLPLPTLSPGSA
jgi:signal transduction histidine kinase